MGVLTLYAADSAIVRRDQPNTNFYSATQTTSDDYGAYCMMFMKFSPTASQLAQIKGRKIQAVTYYLYCSKIVSSSSSNNIYWDILNTSVNLQTVTWNTMPDYAYGGPVIPGPNNFADNQYSNAADDTSAKDLKRMLDFGARISHLSNEIVQTAKGSNRPYIEITYSDDYAAPDVSPYDTPRPPASETDTTFKWEKEFSEASVYDPPGFTAQSFKWRVKNSSTINTVTVPVDENSCTIPAGTFPIGAIEWTISLTTDLGATTQEDWITTTIEQPLIQNMTPGTGAYAPKHEGSVFTWDAKQRKNYDYVDVEIKSATLYWRQTGSATAASISATGGAKKCVVPAETFSADSVDWMVTAVTAAGNLTISSDWVTVSTVEATPAAKTVSPSGIVIDATIVNRFSWQHIISTGTAQTKADLQWSADSTAWNTLATVTGENQYYDVPANTFASGTKYWRVRTYNTDGTASEWSAAAEFIAINAPSAPSIVIQSTGARPRITWQTSEQEAYQLTLSSGYASGTVYGADKSWRSPVYLADGSYTVRVRVQNQYGLWSDWGSAALPVSHTEGEAITITAAGSHVAALDWQTAGSYDFYIVERDGAAIARTTQTSYIDHTSIGDVTYQVRGCYADSDSYGISNAVTVSVLPDTAMVCDLESGTWQRLALSETILRTSRTNRTATIQTVHLSGLDYPVAERSEFRDRALQISCAFLRTNRAAALALEALVGRLVCAKTKQGDMAVGYITALEKNADEIMSRYSFEITHIYRKEAITLDS